MLLVSIVPLQAIYADIFCRFLSSQSRRVDWQADMEHELSQIHRQLQAQTFYKRGSQVKKKRFEFLKTLLHPKQGRNIDIVVEI